VHKLAGSVPRASKKLVRKSLLLVENVFACLQKTREKNIAARERGTLFSGKKALNCGLLQENRGS
jgi:hypothetical protein